jgi:serine/threonine protein kinase
MIELIGQGTFGKVFKGKIKKTGQIVAIKRVFQDPKYKNREI